MSGVVIKKIDHENGIIKGEDNILYYFSKINYLKDFDLSVDDLVVFKPVIGNLNKAVFIVKK